MIKKEDINKIIKELDSHHNTCDHIVKYVDILTGEIEYTNDDINELIAYFTAEEMYEMCEGLVKLIK